MGRVRKSFIDKKNSTTYNLIHKNTDAGEVVDGSGRVFVDADKGVGLGRVDEEAAAAALQASGASQRRYPPGHPLAWLEAEESGPSSSLTPARRRELVELGFPDDGYDYLAHLRALGGGSNALEGPDRAEPAPVGPGVYVPAPKPQAPIPDEAIYDAHALALPGGEARGDAEAAGAMGGVTAFSRRRVRAPGGADRQELAELVATLEQAEAEAGEEEIGEEGFGDLLDDFILAATAGGEEEEDSEEEAEGSGGDKGLEGEESKASSFTEVESESDDFEERSEPGELAPSQQARFPGRAAPKAGSIASTYWREERSDRRGELTTLDERFEHIALEYDEDEIGDLSDHGSELEGETAPDELAPQLAYLLTVDEQDKASRLLGEGKTQRASALASQLERFGLSDDYNEVAIQKAKEALALAAEEEEAGEAGAPRPHGTLYVPAEHHERERWDAETVLSLRSNLDNHPGRIGGGGGRRRDAARGGAAAPATDEPIRLNRSGFPLGLPPMQRRAAAAAAAGAAVPADGSFDGSEASSGDEGVRPEPCALPQRHRDETPEEKRERKASVKEAQRAARAAKKALKGLFKEERGKAARRSATAQPQAALHMP